MPNNYDIYLFKEGYLKTSGREYDLDSDDLIIHLTNTHV